MAKVDIRYFVTKGRKKRLYYWQPPKALRDQGWETTRLPDDRGKALAEAERINANLDRWRATTEPRATTRQGSVADIIHRYTKDHGFQRLAPATQRAYRIVLKRFEDRFGDLPAASITRKVTHAYKQEFTARPSMGNLTLNVLRTMYQVAVDEGWVESNPVTKPRQFSVPPRAQLWSMEDERAFIRAAEAAGRPSMILALALGIYTAQRPSDIVGMTWASYDGAWIKNVRQRKTGRVIDVPVLAPLRAALDAAPRKSPIILIGETGKPYRSAYLTAVFAKIKNAAGLNHLQFRDLRRTAVVRMGEQSEIKEGDIGAITGHTLDQTKQILEVYMPRTRAMAARVARVMDEYYRRVGNTGS